MGDEIKNSQDRAEDLPNTKDITLAKAIGSAGLLLDYAAAYGRDIKNKSDLDKESDEKKVDDKIIETIVASNLLSSKGSPSESPFNSSILS